MNNLSGGNKIIPKFDYDGNALLAENNKIYMGEKHANQPTQQPTINFQYTQPMPPKPKPSVAPNFDLKNFVTYMSPDINTAMRYSGYVNPGMGYGMPGIVPGMANPIVVKNYNIENPGIDGDQRRMSMIYEDVLPFKKFEPSYSTIGERLEDYNFIRSSIFNNTDGDDIDLHNMSTNSLMNYIKFDATNVNPYNVFKFPYIDGNSPFKGLPSGFVIYMAGYPVKHNEITGQVDYAKNHTNINVRLYKLLEGSWSINKYNSKRNSRSKFFDYDEWRDVAFYEFVREKILKKKVCPNFITMYGYFISNNSMIDYDSIVGKNKKANKTIQNGPDTNYDFIDKQTLKDLDCDKKKKKDDNEKYKVLKIEYFDREDSRYKIVKMNETSKPCDDMFHIIEIKEGDELGDYNENSNIYKIEKIDEIKEGENKSNIYRITKITSDDFDINDGQKRYKIEKTKKMDKHKYLYTIIKLHDLENDDGVNDIPYEGQDIPLLNDKHYKYDGKQNQLKNCVPKDEFGNSTVPIYVDNENNHSYIKADLSLYTEKGPENNQDGFYGAKLAKNSKTVLKYNDDAYLGKSLVVLTESPTFSIFGWASRTYVEKGNIFDMVGRGIYNYNTWINVMFQIMVALYVMQINNFYFENFDIEKNIYIKKLPQKGPVTEYWKYVINGIEYYIPNLGYLVLIDTNFKDVDYSNDINFFSNKKSKEHKIVGEIFGDSDIDKKDFKKNTFKMFVQAFDPNNFGRYSKKYGIVQPPAEIIEKMSKIHSEASKGENIDIEYYIIKHMIKFINNRIGTQLKESEVDNIRSNTDKNYKKGNILVTQSEAGKYKFVMFHSVKNGMANIFTKENNKDKDFIVVQIPTASLKSYNSEEIIEQKYKIDEENLAEDSLIETYVIYAD